MFGSKAKKEGAFEGRLNCMVGEESKFRGDISVNGSARIDGEFEGSIVATESVIVGRSGLVRAHVQARDMVVAGLVSGNLMAHERVELHTGARVDGDIETHTLLVDEGVVFNGKCSMPEPVTTPEGQAGQGGGREERERDRDEEHVPRVLSGRE